MIRKRAAGALTIAGALGFTVTVLVLHFVQTGYDPVHQLMSELAQGRHRWAMLLAFSFLAASTLLPMGIGQRLAAACVVLWLCLAGAYLLRDAESRDAASSHGA